MKHVLLTGATGFLGSHLLEALLEQGYQVTILKRSTSDTWRIEHLLEQVRAFDIDKTGFDEIFSRNNIKLIIHLATFYRKVDSSSDFEEMINTNITFPSLLLEAGIKAKIKGFINTGTFFEYDCSEAPVSELNKSKPFNNYAKTKLLFDTLLHTYKDLINIVTLRIFSPYGPKDNDKIIHRILKASSNGELLRLSAGFQKLDFIHCNDVVSAYIKAIDYISRSKEVSEIFNIGSGVPTSLREVVSIVEEELGFTINKEWASLSSNDLDLVFADIRKAKEYLRWKPETTVREGILKTMEYYGVLDADKQNQTY